MQPYVIDLSTSLLLCALYDKDTSCRRAAAAAFQENVGRQGNFPRGIEIITEADYFSLGSRQNAYLLVSLFVGHYKEYYKSFVQHLAQVKLVHCDLDIRKLSGATLSLLSCMDPEFMIEEILPSLIEGATSSKFYTRHGSILGIGQILIGLAGKSEEHNLKDSMKDSIFLKTMTVNERKLINAGDYMQKFQADFEKLRFVSHTDKLSKDLKKNILKIISDIESKRLYRGKGGDLVRAAVLRLIYDISLAKIKVSKAVHNKFMDTLDEGIKNSLDIINKESEIAFEEFSRVYHKKITEECIPYVVRILNKSTTDSLISVKRGYTIALSSFSQDIIVANLDKILEVFSKNTEIVKKKTEDDAILRNNAVKALIKTFSTVELEHLNKERMDIILNRLLYVMEDYSVDRRGDIGSLVRESSMYAMLTIIKRFWTEELKSEWSKNYFTAEITTSIINTYLQQLSEKYDKMRLIAGSILQNIFDKYSEKLPDFPQKDILFGIFCNKNLRAKAKIDQEKIQNNFDVSLIDTTFLDYDKNERLIYFWDIPQCIFPTVVPLLQYEEYSYAVLRGL